MWHKHVCREICKCFHDQIKWNAHHNTLLKLPLSPSSLSLSLYLSLSLPPSLTYMYICKHTGIQWVRPQICPWQGTHHQPEPEPDKAILEEQGETNTYHRLATSDKPAGALTHSTNTKAQDCGHNSPPQGIHIHVYMHNNIGYLKEGTIGDFVYCATVEMFESLNDHDDWERFVMSE